MIVVTGATGNVGRPLVRALAAAGAKVTAVSRRAGDAAVPAGVLTVAADLTDPESLRPALDGADALFLHDGGAGAPALRPREILDAVGAAGVSRVVLLSSQGVRTRPESHSHGVVLRAIEDAVRESVTDPASLRPALDGADALFLHDGGASAPALRPRELLDAVGAAGVSRVVLLSSQGVRTRPESHSHGVLLRAIEDAVRESGPDWTILRPGGFHSNMYAWSASVRARRTVVAPFGDVGLPTIDPADVAGVAAKVLLEDGHAGKVYELTGPALTTPRQRTETIGEALGEPVRFVEQSREEARAQMLEFMPAWAVDTTLAVLGAPTSVEQRISPAVEQVLGRAPRTFADWVQDHISAFRPAG